MVNSYYTDAKTLAAVQEQLNTQDAIPVVALQQFLDEATHSALQQYIATCLFTADETIMSHRFATATIQQDAIEKITHVITAVFGSAPSHTTLYQLQHKDFALRTCFPQQSETLAVLDLTEHWDEDAGGLVTCTDGQGNAVVIPPLHNALFFVKKSEEIDQFISYVNNRSGDRKRHLLFFTS